MATISSANIISSKFIGCPISIPVTAATVSGATFQRVRLLVEIADANSAYTGLSGDYVFEFSSPVDSGDTVYFDISSAFRAVADQMRYEPTTLNAYPKLQANLTAYDDYMIDGTNYEGITPDNNSNEAAISFFYVGKLTDKERLGNSVTMPARYSRKPVSSPELAFVGGKILHAAALVNNATPQPPSVTEVNVTEGLNAANNYYGIAVPADAYEIRFINSLGVHENVFVTCLRTLEVPITTNGFVLARQETLTDFSRGVNIKENNRERWRMSSPSLDRAWLQWYIHEFLMARWAWIAIPNNQSMANVDYIPIHILPDEITKGIDRPKNTPLSVEFTIEFDINGSPF